MDGTSAEPPTKSAALLRAGLLLMALALLASWLFGTMSDPDAEREVDLESPLPAELPRCSVLGEGVLAHAQALEGLADASWERLPFDDEEAPHAVLRAAEAESCYRVAGEREGMQRTAIKLRTFKLELQRRWLRTKLLLDLARRRGDPAEMQRGVGALLALSRQAGPAARHYREHLQRLHRMLEAQLLEATAEKE